MKLADRPSGSTFFPFRRFADAPPGSAEPPLRKGPPSRAPSASASGPVRSADHSAGLLEEPPLLFGEVFFLFSFYPAYVREVYRATALQPFFLPPSMGVSHRSPGRRQWVFLVSVLLYFVGGCETGVSFGVHSGQNEGTSLVLPWFR